MSIPLYTLSLGDLAFVFSPYEMFDTNGKEIKEGSPYETTIVATCSNFMYGYVPSKLAYEYGGKYEVDGCRFVEGTGELSAQDFVKTLTALYPNRK